MLAVTEAARLFLAELIHARGFSHEIAVRLFYGDEGFAMVGDSERAGDAILQHEGRTVLLLGESVSDLLADRCLVVDGAELKLRENSRGAGDHHAT